MAKNNIDLEALKADIENEKNAASTEEVDEIMDKYNDAIKDMERDLKTRSDIDASSVKQNGKSGRYSGKYVITVGGDDLYRFKLVASNGQSLFNSEGNRLILSSRIFLSVLMIKMLHFWSDFHVSKLICGL